MIGELISNITNNILNSFDIGFCAVVNIATYLIIKTILNIKNTIKLNTWIKRVIFVVVGLTIAAIYCITGSDYKIIFNSLILAPVSWSWIFKPICSKLKIDYNKRKSNH